MDRTRRSFLRRVALAGGAAAVTGCLSAGGTGTEGGDGDGDDEYEGPPERLSYTELEILDTERGRIVAFTMDAHTMGGGYTERHWHFEPLRVYLNGSKSLRGRFGGKMEAPAQNYTLRADVVGNDTDVVTVEERGDGVRIHGEERGETEVVFTVNVDGETVYETPAFDVRVDDWGADG